MSPTYIVEEKLGKGGFGQVYIGRRKEPSTSQAQEGANANKVGLLQTISLSNYEDWMLAKVQLWQLHSGCVLQSKEL